MFTALALGDRLKRVEVEYLVEPLVLEEVAPSLGSTLAERSHERYLVGRSAVFDERNTPRTPPAFAGQFR